MRELVIVANDRVGLLADITGALAKANINIEGVELSVVGKKSVCRILTKKDEFDKAKKALSKAKFKVLDSDVIVVKVEDKPGELSSLSRTLADSDVSITNVHLLGKSEGFAIFAIETSHTKIARGILSKYL
jgi:hypothetical protein